MFAQVFQLIAARRDCQNFGANRSRASDIERGVAYHQHFLAAQFSLQKPLSPPKSNRGNLVSVFMVIAKPAGFEMAPQSIMRQLDFRSQSNIAGKQANQRRLSECSQTIKKL